MYFCSALNSVIACFLPINGLRRGLVKLDVAFEKSNTFVKGE